MREILEKIKSMNIANILLRDIILKRKAQISKAYYLPGNKDFTEKEINALSPSSNLLVFARKVDVFLLGNLDFY